ncbi:MAG TPA: hypothetical protein VG649_24690 [Candidatus Angelobacter sp.]|nr:hypothetical protein [Candidatus Angelobacter sp.]
MRKQALVLVLFTAFTLLSFIRPANAQTGIPNPCPNAKPVPEVLHLPADLPVSGEDFKYEEKVLSYLNSLDYRRLGWCEDKGVRDTGPFINNFAAIVHPGVRIFYSPEVSNWLLNGRQGAIPDGAVIIKEQFPHPPAERYANTPVEKLGCPNDWTFMIKNSKVSRDGWFWGELFNPMDFNNPNRFQYPNTGYGLYCLRCHASAEKELTFASLTNIKGAPGFPLQFRVDDSWRAGIQPLLPTATCKTGPSGSDFKIGAAFPSHAQNAAILAELTAEKLPNRTGPLTNVIQIFPPETLDNVVAPPGKAAQVSGAGVSPEFVTSSQCLTCHSGLSNSPFGPSMAVVTGTSAKRIPTGVNFSAYGEWRWSPMGLAGRDPVFYAQLDSELAFLRGDTKTQQGVIDTCLNCHGAMGKKSYAIEHPDDPFQLAFIFETNPSAPGFKYGGLARDGISCLMCHRNAPPAEPGPDFFFSKDSNGNFRNINGNFRLVPADQLYGPFKDDDITTYPMDTGLGVKPKFNAYLQSSQMCGSCHTIILPVLDKTNQDGTHPFEVEQATYPEWLNSQYRNEYGSVGAKPESCQFCHMPAGYSNAQNHLNIQPIQTRIAVTQDLTYPEADHLAKPDQLNVRYRQDGYRRHELLGTNGFLLQMFLKPVNAQDNNEILGVRLPDYFTGFLDDLKDAAANVVTQAQTITADVQVTNREGLRGVLTVDVTVTNKTGHRFPSGVGFRRAFLEFVVKDKTTGEVVFSSGTTNEKGQITDMNGKVLETEGHVKNAYQPHFNRQNPITSTDQVQIYEELVEDAKGNLTFSFTRRDEEVKDNRLLPIGWSKTGPQDLKLPKQILESTMPKGTAKDDPVYLQGNGQSVVRYRVNLPKGKNERNFTVEVALWSQTLPQDFLDERYQTPGPATNRLRFLADSLGTLAGTDYENWKLLIARAK